jgi:uncharacterized protein YndB with AHSA1/START domain
MGRVDVTDFGTLAAPGVVRFERLLPGPIERVWAFLTEPEKRARWLAGGEMQLHVGGRVELRFRHADLSPVAAPTPERFSTSVDGSPLHGTVTACEPPRLLAFTWGDGKERPSEVTFGLEAVGDGVRLTVTHRRLGDELAVWANVAGGWHTHLAILEDRLHDRVPQPFFAAFEPIEAAYLERFGASVDRARETLRIVRRFEVAPEVVFEALTVPEAMRVWWTEQTTFDLDLRVGGRWTIERREGDQTFVAEGEYLEVEPPRRLRFTIGMPQFSPNRDTISVEIEPEGAGCVVVFVQSGDDIAAELRDLAPGERSASEAGWQQGLDLMEEAWT